MLTHITHGKHETLPSHVVLHVGIEHLHTMHQCRRSKAPGNGLYLESVLGLVQLFMSVIG